MAGFVLCRILLLLLPFKSVWESHRAVEETTNNNNNMTLPLLTRSALKSIEALISTDAGGRGMKHLIVEGDFEKASIVFGSLPPASHVLLLSGFPCCVQHKPPTETDGPPGTAALARAASQLGHAVTVLTEDCNERVFAAALEPLLVPQQEGGDKTTAGTVELECFPSSLEAKHTERLQELADSCSLIVACERAGPAKDGVCYTMRGIDMNQHGLVGPLHRVVEMAHDKPFLAIGDGGNELGMGRVIDKVRKHIPRGDEIGCVVAANHLVAASVSNWGGYALAAGAALVRASMESSKTNDDNELRNAAQTWTNKCLPTEDEEVALLQRCVKEGCRDGVSGKVEATVDGMPLETSMECLRSIRETATNLS